MKKIAIEILFFILVIPITYGKQIDENTAKFVGQQFLFNKSGSTLFKNKSVLNLTQRIIFKDAIVSSDSTQSYYIFNIESNNGFVIVSGDDRAKPILGFSDEGSFDPINVAPGLKYWLDKYRTQIEYAKKNDIAASNDVLNEWTEYQNGKSAIASVINTTVSPLIQTTWDQNKYYNHLCPADANASNYYDYRCPVGCTVTAMAQIMKFWNYPTKGYGSYQYVSNYRTEFADFGNTTYDWGNMLNSYTYNTSYTTTQINAISTLMYHCGVSVKMNYDYKGSGANVHGKAPSTEYALKTYFGYDNSLNSVYRTNYTNESWTTLLQNELLAGRPILYTGGDLYSDEAHAFVCDGYNSSNYFHFNFGWGSSNQNAYLSINSITTSINNSNQQWNKDEAALVGIKPPANSLNYDLRLYSDFTINDQSFGDDFNFSVDIANYDKRGYSGDFVAAVYDINGNYIDDMDIFTGITLNSYKYDTYTFYYSNAYQLVPGSYYVQLYYRPTGGQEWQSIANGNYQNYASFTVTYNTDIKLYSATTTSCNEIFRQGQSASIAFNVINVGSSVFSGQFGVNITDNNGYHKQEFGVYTENSGNLKPNYHYISPIVFNNTITVEPGNYLLTVDFKDSENQWYFACPGDYQNPIRITVLPAIISADKYESNNTISQSYNLPKTFINNSAEVKTSGSNFHNETDIDYYKLALPSGYNYTISPILQDSYRSNDGNSYTVDAQFKYSTDGTLWSDSYDTFGSNINLNNGGTIYFFVKPYFIGSTGTYVLDINVSRTTNTGIDDINVNSPLRIYPNPVSDMLTIQTELNISKVIIYSVDGIAVKEIQGIEKTISVSALASGTYILKVTANDGKVFVSRFLKR